MTINQQNWIHPFLPEPNNDGLEPRDFEGLGVQNVGRVVIHATPTPPPPLRHFVANKHAEIERLTDLANSAEVRVSFWGERTLVISEEGGLTRTQHIDYFAKEAMRLIRALYIDPPVLSLRDPFNDAVVPETFNLGSNYRSRLLIDSRTRELGQVLVDKIDEIYEESIDQINCITYLFLKVREFFHEVWFNHRFSSSSLIRWNWSECPRMCDPIADYFSEKVNQTFKYQIIEYFRSYSESERVRSEISEFKGLKVVDYSPDRELIFFWDLS